MKLRFKAQPHQTNAVASVMDCFAGQPRGSGKAPASAFEEGFANADIALSDAGVLANIQHVQRRQNLPVSETLAASAGCRVNLDIEMETGTGKTYCYLKTIFEMNKRHGWSKFIVMVPGIAIREGVCKSLQITAGHFADLYGKKSRFFIYNSRRLHELESFASDPGITVMVINIQAFNGRGADNRRIYEELDDFQSRRPIDLIASSRPVLILDEPQKMEGKATMEALPKFAPLMILRYSATHKTRHNRVHRLDALDAYNRKLVKKIAVRGIQTRGLSGTAAYLYLEGIDISTKAPVARIELEVRQKSGGIARRLRRLKIRDDLFVLSGELDQYRGFTVSQIDCTHDTVEFANGMVLTAGEAVGDVSEADVRRIQIRETIRAHLDREKQLFAQGIKVLSLFFIDEVVKYRDYDRADEKGCYARVFEEEYERLSAEHLAVLDTQDEPYRKHLAAVDPARTHNGYFSIDAKTKRLKDPAVGARGVGSDDVDAYDLILKDKERLLSFDEPTRFIFSHSALREGWDNPNVFVMCMLKHSDNTVSRRQEVGRGLRLCVNQHGDRMDHPALVHDINILTVVARESYSDFVAGLQTEISEALSSRPRHATEAYFTGKTIATDAGSVEVTPALARQICLYLASNGYTDDAAGITGAWRDARSAGTLAAPPGAIEPYAEQVCLLVDALFSEAQLPRVDDGRKQRTRPGRNDPGKRAFQKLWARINGTAAYRIDFDSDELVNKCVAALDARLRVAQRHYTVQTGVQRSALTDTQLRRSEGFENESRERHHGGASKSTVSYDLVGRVAAKTRLTRKSTAAILSNIKTSVFDQFRQNPEHFIAEASRIIVEQQATMLVEHLTYDECADRYGADIFTANQAGLDFSGAAAKLNDHVCGHAVTGKDAERELLKELYLGSDMVVHARLPRGFAIPTPVGNYNPDWAVSFKVGGVRHIYFVAETGGSLSSMELREVERTKIDGARGFLGEIGKRISEDSVRYDAVDSYDRLMDILGRAA